MSDRERSPRHSRERLSESRKKVPAVFVGGLSDRVMEQDIQDIFGKYGQVSKVELKRGFCFVEYVEHREAEDAIRELNGTELDGSRIRVEFSKGPRRRENNYNNHNRPPFRQRNRVLVDNISYDISWQGLKDHMRSVGDVVYADIFRDRVTGRSKGRGAVEFRNSDDMQRAIRKLNDTKLGDRYIVVKEDFGYRRFNRYSPYDRYSRRDRFSRRRSPYGRDRYRRRYSRSPRRYDNRRRYDRYEDRRRYDRYEDRRRYDDRREERHEVKREERRSPPREERARSPPRKEEDRSPKRERSPDMMEEEKRRSSPSPKKRSPNHSPVQRSSPPRED